MCYRVSVYINEHLPSVQGKYGIRGRSQSYKRKGYVVSFEKFLWIGNLLNILRPEQDKNRFTEAKLRGLNAGFLSITMPLSCTES